MLSILAAILVFGFIVLFHEFGHFLLAKLNGIGVLEFSVGMGPRLISFVKGETRYSIKILPFGGSCMMMGEDGEDTDQRAFNNKSVWARISVIAAGPVFNFILAFILGTMIIACLGYDAPKLEGVLDGYPAQEAGLQAGDVITKINNKKITVYRDVSLYMYLNPGEPLDVEFRRDGVVQKTHMIPKYSQESQAYMMGIQVERERTRVTSPLEGLKYGAYEVQFCVTSTFDSLKMLVTGRLKANEAVAGPVRMVSIIGDVVEESSAYGMFDLMINLANLSMILSASLGIMNLLPIPALDGGRLVFLIVEAFRGKPIDREKEGMIHMAGMVVLMMLMVVVLFNDIWNLFKGIGS